MCSRKLLMMMFPAIVASTRMCASPDGTCAQEPVGAEEEDMSLLSMPHHHKPSNSSGLAGSSISADLSQLEKEGIEPVPTETLRKIFSAHGEKFSEDPDPSCVPPPLYRITATSMYDAGKQHGAIARERIHGWFNSSGMKEIFSWVGIIPPAPQQATSAGTVEGQHTEGQHTEGQHSEGQHSEGQHSEGQHSEGQHTEGQHTGGQHTGGQHTEGQHTEGQHGQHKDGQHKDGQHKDGQHMDGQHMDGSRPRPHNGPLGQGQHNEAQGQHNEAQGQHNEAQAQHNEAQAQHNDPKVDAKTGEDAQHNSYNGMIGESEPGQGRELFEKLKADNAKEFPEFEEEIRGIAEGSGLPLDQIWAANLLIELDFIRAQMSQSKPLLARTGDHCSDLYAVSKGGYRKGFAHGHNEDETEAIKPFYYFISYTFKKAPGKSVNHTERTKLTDCAGLTYPGSVFGLAVMWNKHGMWGTQNTLHLRKARMDGGLAAGFVQRRAICEARDMDDVIALLSTKGWNGGVSMNVVDLKSRRMANVETFEDMAQAFEVTEEVGNYSHFNAYKHLNQYAGYEIDNPLPFLKVDRQGKVDSLPPMHTADDIMTRLSLKELFRPNAGFPDRATIATLVVNGSTGHAHVWTCGKTPANHPRNPSFVWNLLKFFH